MSLYEDKANLKNLAITIIFFGLIFNTIMSGYIYATSQIGQENDHIGQGLDTIFGNTIGTNGRYNLNEEITKRQISNLSCTPENPTCNDGILATTSIQNTGFDPAQEQINWGKIGRLLAELAAMTLLPIRYTEPLIAIAGGTLIASTIITIALVLWQIIIAWAMWKALKG